MDWTVDDNRPVNFVRFKTKIYSCVKISWHCWDSSFNFCSERTKVIFSVSVTKPTNSICFTGWRTDFSSLITKSKCCNRKINASLSMRISGNILPISNISMTCLKRAIETFNNFVKIIGADPSPNHGQKNSYWLPAHWDLTNFCELLLRATEKYASLRYILHGKSSCSRRDFRQCRPSILNCSLVINLLRFYKFMTGRFLPSFFSTRKKLFRNCPCVGTNFWIALFSNISKMFCSTNENCSYDIFVKFGFFFRSGRLTNWNSSLFTIDISWFWVLFFPDCYEVR